MYFTFMLPRIVIDFFLNNQQDVLIIQIYSVIKLYMFRASSLPIIRIFPPYIRQFHRDSAWKRSSKSCNPDDWQRRCPKHVEFYKRINLDN
jgi:hypothetical protein